MIAAAHVRTGLASRPHAAQLDAPILVIMQDCVLCRLSVHVASSGSHHAAGAAVGYVFQLEYALLSLVPCALADEELAVSVEVYDDVAFHTKSGRAKEVVQVHHTLKSVRELIDTSAKTWRTLAIWAEEWRGLDAAERRDMTLVTTQKTRRDSGLEALTRRAWDLDKAVETFSRIARDQGEAAGTAVDRATFDALGPDDQRALLSRVTVVDSVARATDGRAELEKALMGSHEARFVPAVADLVEGWWWPRVVRALSDREPVSATELRAIIDDARRILTDLTLPIRELDDLEDDRDATGVPSGADFVRCLRSIELNERRVSRAIDDFLHASAHRSYWLRRTLVLPQELVRYDERLIVEWDDRCDRTFHSVDGNSTDSDKVAAGRAVYDELTIDMERPLREAVRDPFVQRGSLHRLADNAKVAWHPDEASPLRDSLSREATP